MPSEDSVGLDRVFLAWDDSSSSGTRARGPGEAWGAALERRLGRSPEPPFRATGRPRFIDARILIVDGDRILLEFDVPDGMAVEMPGRDARIALTDRPDPDTLREVHELVRLIESDSTRSGRYGAGLTLRLALEGPDWTRRLAVGLLFVAWESAGDLVVLVVQPRR
jgi:hypothetical protein